jgi:hypothetical protein
MANYQPNYIYSPLYGNRYMGGSRTPAPSTGGAGQVDTSSIQSRNTAVGVPYSPVVQEQQGPYGFSSTGRDQSAIESLGTFGFRDMSGLTMDPFEGTDYLTNGFGSPAPINTRYVESVPEATVAPPVSFDGGGDNDNSINNIYSGQGIQAASSGSNDRMSFETMPMDLAWGLYGVGRDLPPLAQALVPGVQAAQFVGGQMLDQQIDAIDQSFNVLDTVPDNVVTSSDQYGNVYASGYKPDSVINESNTDLSPAEFSQLSNSLPEGASVQGVDAAGNVNVTMPDGTTARAGVSPNTGQVNTYNFNVNDTVTYSNSDQFQDNDDGDQFSEDAYSGGSTTESTAASEDAYSAPTTAPQTNEELDADSADSGTGGGK